MSTGSHRGKPSVPAVLEAERQGMNAMLTPEGKGVSVDATRGPEAEVTLDDQLFLFLDEQSRDMRDFLRSVREES